jgi:DNA polymerase-3 subunit alpha
LNDLFQSNKGDNLVTFEVVEREIIKIEAKPIDTLTNTSIDIDNNTEEMEFSEENEIEIPEDIKTVTVNKITMPSRKLKIKISHELLSGLEKLQLNFKLN